MTRNYKAELAALEAARKQIEADQYKHRGNKKFKCAWCPNMHTISKCDAFLFPTWESGSGYDDGRWWEGEIYVRCPETQKYNRCYFPTNTNVDYRNRQSYDYNADMQFKRMYRDLFKSLTTHKDNYKPSYHFWSNNFYFDENHKKFDIHVKGIDK